MSTATKLDVHTDSEGHLRYDFVIDKRHIEALRTKEGWSSQMEDDWQGIQKMEGEVFFQKAFTFFLFLQQLHLLSHTWDGYES